MKIKDLNEAERNLSLSRRGSGRRADRRILQHRLPTCPDTGHDRYARREQAQDAVKGLRFREARRVQAGGKATDLDWYSYPCDCCKGWHVARLDSPRSTEGSGVTGFREPALHGLDLENLLGGGDASVEDAEQLWNTYRQQGPGIGPDDLVIVAGSIRSAEKFSSVIGGPNVRWAVGSNGPDGADAALLRAINPRRHSKKFQVAYIGSGDHIFTDVVRQLQSNHVKVRLVVTEREDGTQSLAAVLRRTGAPRILIRIRSREIARRNVEAIHLIARTHRRVHVETAAA